MSLTAIELPRVAEAMTQSRPRRVEHLKREKRPADGRSGRQRCHRSPLVSPGPSAIGANAARCEGGVTATARESTPTARAQTGEFVFVNA